MQIRENLEARDQILGAAIERMHERSLERAPGLHVSELVYCLRAAWYKRQGIKPPEDANAQAIENSIFLLGQGHHAVLQPEEGAEMHCILVDRTNELSIFGTIDVFKPDNPLWSRVTEIKTTRYSSNKPLAEGMPQYLEQLASYCLMEKTTLGRVVVWHIMGDYRGNRNPILRVWDVDFDPEELERWALEMWARRDILLGSELPGVDGENHRKDECGYCPFHEKRGGPCEGGDGRPEMFFVNYELPSFMGGTGEAEGGRSPD